MAHLPWRYFNLNVSDQRRFQLPVIFLLSIFLNFYLLPLGAECRISGLKTVPTFPVPPHTVMPLAQLYEAGMEFIKLDA